jgi:Protein of unknown function (DUF4238)
MGDKTNSFGHYVPKFILRYFTEDGLVHVYDRENKLYEQKDPKDIAGEKAYYVFTDQQGEKNDALENMFQPIESKAARLVQALHQGKASVTKKEKAALATFLAAQHTRVPESLRTTEGFGAEATKEIIKRLALMPPHFDKTVEKFEQERGRTLSDKTKAAYRKTAVNKNYTVEFPKEFMLDTMLKLMHGFSNVMYQMEWIVLIAPKDKAFISSDHPVFTFNPKPEGFWGSAIGLMALNCETTAVLTPKIAIYLSQNLNSTPVVKFTNVSSDLVDTINLRTAICSSRFVFSHALPLVRQIVEKTRLGERPPYSQVIVS